MTIQEIVNELDGLKDFTNDHGRAVIEHLKAEIHQLLEKPVVKAAVIPKEEPKEEFIPVNRRSPEKDPGEKEQILAESLLKTHAHKKKSK